MVREPTRSPAANGYNGAVRKTAFTLLLFAFGPCVSGPDVPNLHSPGRTIVCLGDSITSGYGAAPGPAFPEILKSKLGTEVINQGVPGDTAENGLARVDEALASDPWLVVVELGGNDILNRVPPERTEAALRSILQRLLAANVVPMLVEVEVPFAGRYAEIYGRLADEYNVPLVDDALGEILLDPALKSDPIHPNAQGQVVLAEAIEDEIEPLIEVRKEAR
jgi:acyl-CoA thioesterase I